MFMNKKSCCPMNQCNPCQKDPCMETCEAGPIMECPVEKCVQKDIIHEVQHICPINTKIINNHIFKHVYIPQYSCCEEDIVTNVDDCCGNMFNN